MKKTIFLFSLICIGQRLQPRFKIIIKSLTLTELYGAFGIQPAQAIPQTQKLWLRKNGQERWEMRELSQERRTLF